MDLVNFVNASNVTFNNATMETSAPSTLKRATDIVLTTTLVIIMLGMGCTIELKKLAQHLRRPIGPAIGMFAQFIVLPLATFGFCHALQLESMSAIGMLVMGCCPGGSTSNLFSYWADGDVPLSLTMTSLGTVVAIGMMPLNLWIYSRSWTDEDLIIPYLNILISLGMTVGPAVVGILIRWRLEKIALGFVKFSSTCGALSIIVTMVLVSILYPFMYQASWKIYIGAFCLPFIGFIFGMIVAKIFRMDDIRCRTVALETGIQNFPLCMTLISLSFPREIIPKLALFPLLYGVFVITNSVIFVGAYHLIKRYKSSNQSEDVECIGVPLKDYDVDTNA